MDVYGRGLSAINQRLDHNELGLHHDTGTVTNSQLQTEDFLPFTSLRFAWLSLPSSDCDGDGPPSACAALQRLQFVQRLFTKHFTSRFIDAKTTKDDAAAPDFVALFQSALVDYNGAALINDHEHVKAVHDELEDETLESSLQCTLDGCCELTMQWRRRNVQTEQSSALRTHLESLDDTERTIIDLTIKTHSALCHRQTQMMSHHTSMAPQFNKFVNDVPTEQSMAAEHGDKVHQRLGMCKLQGILIRNRFDASQCVELLEHLKIEQFDSEAGVCDLDGDTSNLFEKLHRNLFLATQVYEALDKPKPVLTFGFKRLYHWRYFQSSDAYALKPAYASLKEECLNNQIHAMDLQRFNETAHEAMVRARSARAKRYQAADKGLSNKKFEIPPKLSLSTSHIFVLMTYCNETEMQRKYKQFGCRDDSIIRSAQDPRFARLKRRNAQIAHWYKLLYEAVEFYGERVTTEHKFYTGMGVRLLFDSFTPQFNAPLSTTTAESIALRFSKNSGLVLKLVPVKGSMDMFFDVEWLSDYELEKERLFVLAWRLRIVSITIFEGTKATIFKKCSRCFLLWSSLFSGHWVSVLPRRKQTQELLLSIIQNYKERCGITSEQSPTRVHMYVHQVFSNLLRSFRMDSGRKYVIEDEYVLLNEPLRGELMHIHDGAVQLSPFMRSLCEPRQIALLPQFVWPLGAAEFKDLPAGHFIYSDDFIYKLSESSSVTFQFRFGRKTGGSESAGFGLVIKELPASHLSVSGAFSFIVNEAGPWFMNMRPFKRLVSTESIMCL